MIVGATATRLLSRGNRGLLSSQLLLPFRRWHLALGKAVAALQLGILVSVPVPAFPGVVGVVTAGPDRAARLTTAE